MPPVTCQSSRGYFEAMADVFGRLDHDAIDAYADVIFEAWADERRVFVFGNGGSAYTASHHVTDYVKTASVEGRRRLQAISLVDNLGLLTAIGNDIDYDDVFRYGLESSARAGDVAVAISASGRSPNVVRACEWAKANGLTVVAVTGFQGGLIGPIADLHLNVPSENYGIIEDGQMAIGHVAAQVLQRKVAAATSGARGVR
ncbi:MAG: D-sedoheptulose-7-phosphate isomerase [Planctomycetota bacterium]|jgi:phosphoheptose isomerase